MDRTAPYRLGVFATPCGATHFARIAFQKSGLDVGSEDAPRSDGQVAWTTALHPIGTFQLRLHQVRDPIQTISGIQIYAQRDYFREEVSPRVEVPFTNTVQWATQYWMKWHAHCEFRCDYRYRVEDFETEYFRICDMLGLDETVLPEVSRDFNSKRRHYNPLTAKQICDALGRRDRLRFVSQCRRYGYDV